MKNNSALLLSAFFKPFILQTITPMPMKRIILFSICAMAMMLCHAQTTVRVKKAGTLETVLSASQQDTCRHLIVKGKLNSADLQVLRRMAGYDDGTGRTGRLTVLDLQKAKFITDKNPFMELDAANEYLAGLFHPKKVHISSLNYFLGGEPQYKSASQSKSLGNNCDYLYKETMISTLRYKPIYFINHRSGISLIVQTAVERQGGGKTYMSSESEFSFANGTMEKTWDSLCIKKLNSFNGHKIEKHGSRYILKVTSQKAQFSPITFYKCPSLRIVYLPKRINLYPHIYDEGNRIVYFMGKNLVRWDYPEIQQDIRKKMLSQEGIKILREGVRW